MGTPVELVVKQLNWKEVTNDCVASEFVCSSEANTARVAVMKLSLDNPTPPLIWPVDVNAVSIDEESNAIAMKSNF